MVATFVDAGPLFTLLSNTDHQVMYGRRGTGKTHALKYLGETVLAREEHSIYVDMRTVGSNGGLYADTNVPTTERGTRVLVDTLAAIHDALIDLALERADGGHDVGASYELLDQLGRDISEVRVSGPIEHERATADENGDEQAAVMDRMTLGTEEEAEAAEPTDRAYWESHGSKATLKLADELLAMVSEVSLGLEPKYNKFYIGLAKDGVPNNFLICRPRRKHLQVEFRIPKSDELTRQLEDAGIDLQEYSRWGSYRMRLTAEDFSSIGNCLLTW